MSSNRRVDDPCNTEAEEDPVTLRRKRLRRVSFADQEITSVHIFNRDSDYDTPPEAEKNQCSSEKSTPKDQVVALFKDSGDGEYFVELLPEDEDEEEGDVQQSSFLRPRGSPSPGGSCSSITGSATSPATSNDEGEFFGPVSPSFIRPGLCDSGASDVNHDITMDSTAFSMHFRSLARSDSGGDLKTPTARISFEEKPSGQTTILSDAMVITNDKQLPAKCSYPIDKVNESIGSLDMSLVDQNTNNHDYERLSPATEAILEQGTKDLSFVSFSSHDKTNSPKMSGIPDSGDYEVFNTSKSLKMSGISPLDDNAEAGKGKNDFIVAYDMSAKEVSVARSQLGEAEGSSVATIVNELTHDCVLSTDDNQDIDLYVHCQVQTPIQLQKVNKENNSLTEESLINFEIPAANKGTSQELISKSSLLNNVQSKESSSRKAHDSPEPGSIHSLSAKRQHIFKDPAKSSQHLSSSTASPTNIGLFSGTESTKRGKTMTHRITKGFEPSPASDAMDGIRRLKLQSPMYHSLTTSPLNDLLWENKSSENSGSNVPINNLMKQFSFDLRSREHASIINMDGNDIGNLNIGIGLNKETKGLLQSSFVEQMSQDLSKGTPTQPLAAMASPSISMLSQNKKYVLPSQKSSGDALVLRRFNSSTAETTLSNGDDKEVTSPLKSFSPTMKRLEQKSLLLAEHQIRIYNNTEQQDQHDTSIRISSGQEFVRNVSPGGSSTGMADMSFRTLSIGKNSANTGSNKKQSSEEHPERNINISQYGSSFPYDERGTLKEQSLVKSPAWKQLTKSLAQKKSRNAIPSPLTKDPISASHSNNLRPVENNIPSPASNSNMHGDDVSKQELRVSRMLFSKQNVENSSARRKTNEDPLLRDGDNSDNMLAVRNPKINNSESDIMSKTWTDVYNKFSSDTEKLLSPLAHKLNINAIDKLHDFLVRLKKVKEREILCSGIQSQKMNDHSSNALRRRVADTKMLLCKVAIEKAISNLLRIKQEKLLKIGQLLGSAVHESEMLKLSCTQHLLLSNTRSTQVDDNHHISGTVSVIGEDRMSDKVVRMRHELESLNMKLKNTTKAFQSYYKWKSEPSSSEMIELLSDQLKKKSRCQLILQDLQLWKVEDAEKENDQSSIVLNFLDFMSKRITVIKGHPSMMSISYSLKDTNILKSFPNMNACSVFNFVFKAETTKNSDGSKFLAYKIDRTSSLLSKLLDVCREVQLAQLEIRNLTKTHFLSPSDDQLALQLYFTDFNKGRKVTLTLDLSCLKHGVYPSEDFSHQLQISPTWIKHSVTAAEINVAIDGLTPGYFRIIRLCKCVSHILQQSWKD